MALGPRTGRRTSKKTASGSKAQSVGKIVREAAERIHFSALEIAPGLAPQEIFCELHQLCDLLDQDTSPIQHQAHEGAAKVLLRSRLLDLLRAETLRLWTEAPPRDTHEILRVLQAFERLKLELDSLASHEALPHLSDSRGLELAVELAHDLRSPLTSILFLSETILRGGSGPVNEIQQRQLGIIYSAALGLIGTASDVMELARGAEHLEPTQAAAFSLTEILEGVRDMVMPIAEEKGLELRITTVSADRRAGYPIPLSRVLLNLTTNALKFTDTGMVELAVRPIGDVRLEISVRDTGRGIDENALATLYQPIRRRGGGRRGYQIAGTGLGLSICRKLVNAMGGELHLETRPNWGTRFSFELDMPVVA
jgi:signal transduction histidine kinase